MWIDTRSSAIKVYETRPNDPYVKKMTWVPGEGAWILFGPPTPTDVAELLAIGGNPEAIRQVEIMRQFERGEVDYATMRMNCG